MMVRRILTIAVDDGEITRQLPARQGEEQKVSQPNRRMMERQTDIDRLID